MRPNKSVFDGNKLTAAADNPGPEEGSGPQGLFAKLRQDAPVPPAVSLLASSETVSGKTGGKKRGSHSKRTDVAGIGQDLVLKQKDRGVKQKDRGVKEKGLGIKEKDLGVREKDDILEGSKAPRSCLDLIDDLGIESVEGGTGGTVFLHPSVPRTLDAFATALIYVPRRFVKNAKEEFGNIVALLLENQEDGRIQWVAGLKRVCGCNQKVPPCSSFGVSQYLWHRSLQQQSSWVVRRVIHAAERSCPPVGRIVLTFINQASEDTTHRNGTTDNAKSWSAAAIPVLRSILRGSCVYPGLEGRVIASGSVSRYRVKDIYMANEILSGNLPESSLSPSVTSGPSVTPEIGYIGLSDVFHLQLEENVPPSTLIGSRLVDSSQLADIRKVGFGRIGGMKKLIEMLEKVLIRPLVEPEKFIDERGGLRGIRPTKGILLYGVPGTGKSYFCRAIQEELRMRWSQKLIRPQGFQGVEVIMVTASQIREAADLRNIFEACSGRFLNEKKLTLLIFDEIDALCPKRQEPSGEAQIGIVNTMLTYLDGPLSSWSTFALATTNRPNALDEALRRPGRIDREVELTVPSLDDRIEILKNTLIRYNCISPSKKLQPGSEDFAGQDQDKEWSDERLRQLCLKASGFVPSDIDNWVRVAAEEALFSDVGSDGAIVTYEILDGATKQVRPSALKELSIEIPHVQWEDIGGYEDVKQLLKESVEWPLRYKHVFDKLGLKAPKGILLYGPPGNSKTVLAKAVATQSHMNFISVKGPEIFSKWVGESEERVRDIFRKARQYAPTVIFFDEIDSLGIDRSQSADSGSGVEAKVLSQILNEMDGIGAAAEVVVLGATNRPDALDAALLRPGRFDKLVYVSLPDEIARERIWTIYLSGHGKFSEPEDFKELARHSGGFSGAEIEAMCTSARMNVARYAILHNQQSIQLTLADVKQVLETTKPRTTSNLLQYYQGFAESH
ncbi:AAA family ATPase [Gregarina niphandrodes]|uniref:AAA family ATPase n=1 Tax=Gregarina niphandrodes TaxID=110365 RepID=A0A023BCQ7_GRENI|nr:AAA family ATPase [Gregarina niphandrodes]EZG85840.1 AAA family ATPase [Gregarina niphandrodes]|eukprot:XP_011128817.1 AAA family ATPase [Gregarina niphandrodes]